MDRDTIDRHFRMLDFYLAITPLPTADGGYRTAGADEFMLMEASTDRIAFKHADTRNYVFLFFKGGGWVLDVPRKPQPFHRGEF